MPTWKAVMEMRSEYVEYYLAVCRFGSLNKAAKAFYLSPQGMSRAMHQLEAEIGVPLLERTAHGVEPTEAGRVFYQRFEDISRLVAQAVRETRMAGTAAIQPIRLSFSHDVFRLLQGMCIKELKQRHPDVDVALRETDDEGAFEAVMAGAADLALFFQRLGGGPFWEDDASYMVVGLTTAHAALVVHEDNPLCRLDAARFQDLKGCNVVLPDKAYALHAVVREECAKRGFEPSWLLEARTNAMILALCRQNLGVGITLLGNVSEAQAAENHVRMIPLQEGPHLELVLMSPKERVRIAEIGDFIQILVDHFRQPVQEPMPAAAASTFSRGSRSESGGEGTESV